MLAKPQENRRLNLRPSMRHFGRPIRPLFSLSLSTQPPQEFSLLSSMPMVKDQGQIGSCSANASTTCLEFDNLRDGRAYVPLSRMFAYYNSRAMEGSADSDSGVSNLADAATVLEKYGAPSEQIWPYDPNNLFIRPPYDTYKAAQADVLKGFRSVEQSEESLMAAIASRYPIMGGLAIYSSFMTDAVALSGLPPMPSDSDNLDGGHALVFYGYKFREYWEGQNSWGNLWGMNGRFRIPWQYLLEPSLSYDFLSLAG